MNRFAALLDRLAYEPGRNAKLRLLADYFATTPDPDRGWALAAITGALTFRHAKASVIRALIAERADPVLFDMSYDYVGDLSETVALMWPAPKHGAGAPSPRVRGEGRGEGASPRVLTNDLSRGDSAPLTPTLSPQERREGARTPCHDDLTLTTVVSTLASLGKSELPQQIARWLDTLDETGRWALL